MLRSTAEPRGLKVAGARRASGGTTRALRDITNTGNGKDPLLGASTACSGQVAGARRASGSTRALRDITNTGANGKDQLLCASNASSGQAFATSPYECIKPKVGGAYPAAGAPAAPVAAGKAALASYPKAGGTDPVAPREASGRASAAERAAEVAAGAAAGIGPPARRAKAGAGGPRASAAAAPLGGPAKARGATPRAAAAAPQFAGPSEARQRGDTACLTRASTSSALDQAHASTLHLKHFVGGLGAEMVATEEAVAAAAEADKKAPSRVETACLTRTSTSPALDQAEQEDDEGYARSPQNVAEYVQDIYGLLGRHEGHHLPRHNYMDSQADLNPKMRAILVDWLVEVHMKYKLRLETLFLTVNLIDRSLDQRQTMRQKLQLVGVAAMLIASKFEEINPPEISDFVYITDNAYTKEDILQMEVVILTDLKFDICVPTAAHFMERYQRLNQCAKDSVHSHLVHYLLELSLMDIQMIRYEPSHLVAAATLLSNKLMKQPSWPPVVARQCKFELPAVKECAEDLFGLLEAAQKSPMQAVRKKFSHEKFRSVATRSIMCGGLLV